ncbi:MAG: hypothetical protein V3U80_00975 [Flavobacteriaceae bacterium]
MKTKKSITLQILFTLLLFNFLVSSCSKDEPEDEPITTVETWRYSHTVSEDEHDYNGDGIANSNLVNEIDSNCIFNNVSELKSDGTGTAQISGHGNLIVYNAGTSEYEITCIAIDNQTDEITWTKTDSTRTITKNGDTVTYNVIEDAGITYMIVNYNNFPLVTDEFGDPFEYDNITAYYQLD